MLSRQSHRKSRLGCKRCKARRVKCDEIRPVCGSCRGHRISCDFHVSDTPSVTQSLEPVKILRLQPGQEPKDILRKSTSSVPVLRSTSPTSEPPPRSCYTSPTSMSTPADRLLELRLFHHYIKMSSELFASSLEYGHGITDHQNIATWIADLAVSTPTLMDALIGFSAFHLRCLNPSDHAISQASHRYMARAVALHAKQLREGIDEKNVEPLFATSILVGLHMLANRRFLDGKKVGARLPLHWFNSFQGIQAVVEAGWQWIQNNDIRRFVQWPTQPPASLPLAQGEEDHTFDFLLSGLDSQEYLEDATREAYKSSVAYLSYIHLSHLRRDLLRFPSWVTSRFVELLAAQDPRTLTIMGYYFMMLKKSTRLWWMCGAAEEEFKAVMTFLPKEWWPKMDWAVREFEWVEGRWEC